jgi:hypothetical protein
MWQGCLTACHTETLVVVGRGSMGCTGNIWVCRDFVDEPTLCMIPCCPQWTDTAEHPDVAFEVLYLIVQPAVFLCRLAVFVSHPTQLQYLRHIQVLM